MAVSQYRKESIPYDMTILDMVNDWQMQNLPWP